MSGFDDGPHDDTITCNSCNLLIRSLEERSVHYKTEWHRYNVKRHCAELPPISFELFSQKIGDIRATLQQNQQGSQAGRAPSNAGGAYTCAPCKKTFKKEALFVQHLESNKHKKTDAEKSTSPPGGPSRSSSASKPKTDSANAKCPKESELIDDEKGEKADMGDEKDGDEDENEEEGEGEPIPLLSCLFCTHRPFKTMEESLEHMLKKHGFFIPFVEYLSDLDGLMEYLGTKIGVGHVCLYCTKGRRFFDFTEGCRKHMEAKSHCKIAMQDADGDDDEDILSFYKFPNEDDVNMNDDAEAGEAASIEDAADTDEQKEAKQTATATRTLVESNEGNGERLKRTVREINDADELVLSDGTIIGHRSLNKIYKQKLQNAQTVSKVQRELMIQYFSLKLAGYQDKKSHSEKTIQMARKYQHHAMKVGMTMNVMNRKYMRKRE